MPDSSDVCYLCTEQVETLNLGSSFIVDCPRCGAYEIEAIAATIEVKDARWIIAYLEKERAAGSVRPFIFRELLAG